MYFILLNLDLDKSSFVKSLNDSKILKKRQNKNESIISKRAVNSNIFDSDPTDKYEFKNNREDSKKNQVKKVDELTLIKDISGITQKDQFYIKDNINNSIFCSDNLSSENFNQEDDELDRLKNLQFEKKITNTANPLEMDVGTKASESAKILGDFYFNKIVNAQLNEEIILPEEPISMKYLIITKPIKIIGQPNCLLKIVEGPIIIKINENYDNEVVKFSQVKIQFDINLSDKSLFENDNKNTNKLTFLFKIYPGSIVEIEDCDITCAKDNTVSRNKLICFFIKYCPYPELNYEILSPNITILTIISSRIEKFYQTIRAGENCIINIEKSFINKNIGKPIAVLNPLIVKVVGTIFENNGDNAVHIKFVKDEHLINESRKLFFNNNEFLYNNGSGIFIDGIENFIFDLDITIDSNLFKRNAGDALFFMDLLAKSLIIQKNQFLNGKMNGLNFQKVYQKIQLPPNNVKITNINSLLATTNLEIKENEFMENDGYGIFLSDTKAKISLNNFVHNGMGGILLVSIINSNIYNSNSEKNNSNLIENNPNSNSAGKSTQSHGNTSSLVNDHNSISSFIYTVPGTTTLFKNSLLKNGGSGLKIVNYNNFVSVSECLMKENIEFGIFIESDYNSSILNSNNKNTIHQSDNYSNIMEKIKAFQASDNSVIPKETNLFLHNSSLINNMKSGLFLNSCFAFLENTIISDNLDFSILVPIQQFAKCYKLSKNSKNNLINGNIGGPWGEICVTSKTFCTSCASSTKIKKNKNSVDINGEKIIEEKNKNQNRGQIKLQYNTEDPNKNRNLETIMNNKDTNFVKAIQNDTNTLRKNIPEDNDNRCRII